MRLIWVTQDSKAAISLSQALESKGIQTSVELQGTPCRVWVYDEDRVEEAKSSLQGFLSTLMGTSLQVPSSNLPSFDTIESLAERENSKSNALEHPGQAFGMSHKTPTELFLQEKLKKTIKTQARIFNPTRVTNTLLFLCCFFFISSIWTPPPSETIDSATNTVATPLSWEQLLYFDYPKRQQQIDSVIAQYGQEVLTKPQAASTTARQAFEKAASLPQWQGIYSLLLDKLNKNSSQKASEGTPSPQLFESLREGQWWRLFTPIFLHGDILHLLFNMLWLLLLAPQIESSIGPFRFILLTALVAIGSNTTQYLVSGPAFIGFSGVICAYAGFIWRRTKIAPWEGYFVQPGTFNFLFWFIFILSSISIISFTISLFWHVALPIGIANSAHISGLVLGIFLGSLDYFKAVSEDGMNSQEK